MVTKFGAFYDSTLDRVGDGATFIGIGAFFLTAPDVAYRVPATIACMVAILSSLAGLLCPGPRRRARHRLQGRDRPAGRADPAGRAVLAARGRGAPCPPARGDRRPAGRGLGDHGGAAIRVCLPPRRWHPRSPPGRGSPACRSILSRKDVSTWRNRPRGASRRPRESSECSASGSARSRRRSSPASRTCGAGAAKPIGSLTQMGTIRLGKRTEGRAPLIRDFVPLADLEDLVFGAWDPVPDDAYAAALHAGVLDRHEHLEPIADFLKAIKPDARGVRPGLRQAARGQERQDRARPSASWPRRCGRTSASSRPATAATACVMVWCASTEIFISPGPAH